MKFKWKLMMFYFLSMFGLYIYLKGFFPVKISTAGFSSIQDVPPPPSDSDVLLQLSSEEFPGTGENQWNPSTDLPENYTKLVLIVIGALREDFVYGSKHIHSMPFLHKMILSGDAAGFVSRAHAPTVTMPGIKALTTGSIPNYVDVILNLDQTKELKEDSFIRTASADGRSIVFYGDDTWMKLFPGKFKRREGVTSFFVNDYTIVDNNVSRHLDKELTHADNFDIMILHYLGLDHIGHIAGPKSPLVDSKLKEMDFVIKQIYESLEKHDKTKSSRSLVVVTGDHGMTDKGSHGGTTPHEKNVPILFLSPKINKDTELNEIVHDIQQTDIAVTLSLLFGLPIPRNSMGKTIMPLVKAMGPQVQLHAMQYNCHHLLSLAASTGSLSLRSSNILDPVQQYRDALLAHATWLKHMDTAEKEFSKANQGYSLCQQFISERLISDVALYSNPLLGAGMVVLWLGYLSVILCWGQVVLTHKPQDGVSGNAPSSPLTWSAMVTIGTMVHGISLLSTSFLEEEHQTWYFLTMTFLTVLFASLMSEIAGTTLGMAETMKNGFFSKREASEPQWLNVNHGGLVKRGRGSEDMDPSWDFVELESEQHQLPPKSRKNEISSNIKMIGILVSSLVAHRLLRAWNRTGIQYADLPDIGDWLNDADHKPILSLALILGLLSVAVLLELLTVGKDVWRRYLTWGGLFLVYFYHATMGHVVGGNSEGSEGRSLGLVPARLVYLVVIGLLARVIYMKTRSGAQVSGTRTMDYLISSVVLLGTVLLRPHNVWALAFNLFLYWSVFRQLWPIMNESDDGLPDVGLQLGKIVLRTTLCYWFGQMSYFSTGNSNSLATIDVSAGYVGISSHTGSLEDSVVIFLLIFATYVGPLIWTMLCLADSVDVSSKESKISKPESSQALHAVFSTIAFLRLTPMAFYIILVTAMRHHLFIWSVFAPKLLYETAATCIYGIMLLTASAAAKWIC